MSSELDFKKRETDDNIFIMAQGSSLENLAGRLDKKVNNYHKKVSFDQSMDVDRSQIREITIGTKFANQGVRGTLELATQGEVDAGINNTKAVTPNTLSNYQIGNLNNSQRFTLTGNGQTIPTNTGVVLLEDDGSSYSNLILESGTYDGQQVKLVLANSNTHTLDLSPAVSNVKFSNNSAYSQLIGGNPAHNQLFIYVWDNVNSLWHTFRHL